MVRDELSRQKRPDSSLRLSVIGIIVASLFVALFVRLSYLQVIDGERLAAAAQANQIRTLYTEAPRGRILDRNGHILAGNRQEDVITIDREAVKSDATLLERLSAFLKVDEQLLQDRLDDPRVSPYRPVPVLENVPTSVVATFREREGEFPGVMAETRVQRWYPNGTLAAHVLGYVGEINDVELGTHKDDDYRLGDTIGKAGIEAAYETDLRGQPGVERVEVDSSGRAVQVVSSVPPIPGHDVELTIDLSMQRAAEESLAQGLELAKIANGEDGLDRGGAVVAVDPRDGGVLTMASQPSYDPGSFAKGIPQDVYDRLVDPKGSLPLNNRALQGQYAPGSTFKLITSIAGLRSGTITAQSTVNDGGYYILGDRRLQNAQAKAYGVVDLPKALTVSSDVYYYSLGARIWDARKRVGDAIQATARDFGFDARTGIELGGEASGRIPDPEGRKKLHQQRPDVFPEGNWYAGDTVNLAIGQGDTLVTPLQLANAYAAFANGGTLYEPRIVERVIDADGKTLRKTPSDAIRRTELPASVRSPIEGGLTSAVSDPRGTAHSAFEGFDLQRFAIAGKTGTAQVTGKQDSALFSGYGPASDPTVALSVVLEQSGWGGTYAAPIGRQVFAAATGQSTAPVQLGTGTD